MSYENYFKGKKITLMGLGLLGRGIGDARFLVEQGAVLTVTDLKTPEDLKTSLEALADHPEITFVLGEHRVEDFINADLVIKGAGVPLNNLYIESAKKAGVSVKMSTSLFAELSPATIVGVTGTRGKSTVTHLIYEILHKSGKNIFCGGNVQGISTLAHLPDSTEDEIAVLELDSWQLQGFGDAGVSPHVSAFTTFLLDHMNYYSDDTDAYLADKANIFLNQKEDDFLVLGKQVEHIIKEKYGDVIKSTIVVADGNSVDPDMNKSLAGEHNRENIAVAKEVVRILGIEDKQADEIIEDFIGVPGRLQHMGAIRGIEIYNDTTATTPDATIAGLKAIGEKGKVVLIMGGADKGLPMEGLLHLLPEYCKWVVLLPGTGTERIKSAIVESGVLVREVQKMSDAVRDALELADVGDTVLLSPAFASFGLFKNEYDRGDQFVDVLGRV